MLSLVVVVVAVNTSFSSTQEMIVRVKNVDRKSKNIFFINLYFNNAITNIMLNFYLTPCINFFIKGDNRIIIKPAPIGTIVKIRKKVVKLY